MDSIAETSKLIGNRSLVVLAVVALAMFFIATLTLSLTQSTSEPNRDEDKTENVTSWTRSNEDETGAIARSREYDLEVDFIDAQNAEVRACESLHVRVMKELSSLVEPSATIQQDFEPYFWDDKSECVLAKVVAVGERDVKLLSVDGDILTIELGRLSANCYYKAFDCRALLARDAAALDDYKRRRLILLNTIEECEAKMRVPRKERPPKPRDYIARRVREPAMPRSRRVEDVGPEVIEKPTQRHPNGFAAIRKEIDDLNEWDRRGKIRGTTEYYERQALLRKQDSKWRVYLENKLRAARSASDYTEVERLEGILESGSYRWENSGI